VANIKYNSPIITGKGIEYTFQLHDLAFSGAATEVRLGQGGFVLNENSQGDDVSEAIKATDLTVKLLIEDSTMETYFMGLIDNEEKTVYITILKGTDYYWGGPVLTDIISMESAAYPFEVELRACDYLGTLEKIPFNSANFEIVNGNGINLASVFIADILRHCFPTNDYFYINNDVLFSCASPLYETQTNANLNILETTYIDPKAYTDDLGVYTFTYRQVLNDILTATGMRIKYSNGMFRLIDWRFIRFYNSWEEVTYDVDGVVIDRLEYNNSIPCTADPDTTTVFLQDPINEFDSALSKTQVTLRSTPNCRRDFEDNPAPQYITGFGAQFTPKIAGLIYQTYTNSETPSFLLGGNGEYLKISIKVNAKQEIFPKVKWIYLILEVVSGGVIYRLTNSGTYTNGYDPNRKVPADYVWGTPGADKYVILPFNGSQYLEYNIYTPPLPGASNVLSNYPLYVAAGGVVGAMRTEFTYSSYPSCIFDIN